MRNPVLDIPLSQVMRNEIALPLQQVLHIYTVGHFLRAWKNPRNHASIEQIFDSPRQAHHAAAVCATWLNIPSAHQTQPSATALGWWRSDETPPA
jgi:hypothetical protein